MPVVSPTVNQTDCASLPISGADQPPRPAEDHRAGLSRRAAIALALGSAWAALRPSTARARVDGPGRGPLDETFARLIKDAPDKAVVAVAFHDLRDGREVLVRATEPFHPASTMKLPVMMEVYRQSAEGTLSLDDRLPVRNEFTSIADGKKYALDPADDSEHDLYRRVGGEATVRELTELMITRSSNLATNLLVDRVTPGRATELARALGAPDVVVLRGVEDDAAYARGMNNRSTALGLMRLLQRLGERAVVSRDASEAMLATLRRQAFNEGVPAGLPKGVPVAHKTGSFKGVYHDAALVEPPGRAPYALVVLTRGIDDESRAHRLVADISRAAYDDALGR